MPFRLHLILLHIFITLGSVSYSQVQNSNEVLKNVTSELLGYNTAKALKIIDSQLLADNFSQDTLAILKALKVETLVQAEMYEDALYLVNEVLQENLLKHPYYIKVILQKALTYEILDEQPKSEAELVKVANYYSNHKKDRYYGEYLYRKASLLRVNGEEKAALQLATQAVDYCNKNGYRVEGAISKLVLGLLKESLSSHSSQEAIEYFNDALKEFKSYNDLSGMSFMYSAIARSNIKDQQFDMAEKYLDSILQISKLRQDNAMLSYAYLDKSDFLERTGKIDSALYYHKEYVKYHDSANIDKQALAVSQLDYNFELEKQKIAKDEMFKSLEDSKKYNKLFLEMLIVLGVLIIVIVWFLYSFLTQNRKIKLKNKDIDKSNSALKKSVSEKEFLLTELNHRVKNNLSLIIGLVKFQSNEIEDEFYKDKFNILEKRIHAISLAQEQFIFSDDVLHPSHCDMVDYINKIASSLIPLIANKVLYNQNIEDVKLSIETALPIGIIVNELISNSLKHAKTNSEPLAINLSIEKKSNDIIIHYKDSGILFTDTPSSSSLGMYIIDGMISQLDGTYSRKDTAYSILVKNQEQIA